MKRRLHFTAIAIFVILMSTPAQSEQCTALRVGSTDQWYPMAFLDKKTGQPDGIAHDFVRYVGKQLGLPVKISADIPWKRMLVYVENGSLDLVAAIYRTSERAEKYLYTLPFTVNEARIFVRKDNAFAFASFADLQGKTGIRPVKGSFGEEFDTYAKEHNLQMVEFITKEQMVGLLLHKRADYFIQDHTDGLIYVKNHGLADKIIALPKPVSTTNVHFAFSRNSPCSNLVPKINNIIMQAKQDGTLERIIKDNMP